MASPFGCRSGHISAFAEATLPRDGQVGEGVSPSLDASTQKTRRCATVNLRRAATVIDRGSCGSNAIAKILKAALWISIDYEARPASTWARALEGQRHVRALAARNPRGVNYPG